jgi:hypothetical protein
LNSTIKLATKQSNKSYPKIFSESSFTLLSFTLLAPFSSQGVFSLRTNVFIVGLLRTALTISPKFSEAKLSAVSDNKGDTQQRNVVIALPPSDV